MRTHILARLVPLSLVAILGAGSLHGATAGIAAETGSGKGFVNHRVSSKSIALNQPVRVEFTTMPRQVEGIDIQSAVANALELSRSTGTWRPLGRPTVSEHEKTRTVTIGITLLPRAPGENTLPQIPLTWLAGGQVADFGAVTVTPTLQVGSESRDLPKEVTGVAGLAWGTRWEEVKASFPADAIQQQADRIVVRAQPGLELHFRGGELAEAVLIAPGLDLDRARDSFLGRWGVPQIDTARDAADPSKAEISWLLGWTTITARPVADAAQPGLRIHLQREDIQGKLAQSQVQDRVFDVLEGPAR